MHIALRTGALALALLVGTALTAAPAMADRGGHGNWNNKSWNKSWNKSYNKKHYKNRGHARKGHSRNHRYGWDRGYGGRRYGGYGYGYGYGRAPYGLFYGGPGFTIQIR
jgi:hypothetical protein